jgi:hypothetical protein
MRARSDLSERARIVSRGPAFACDGLDLVL